MAFQVTKVTKVTLAIFNTFFALFSFILLGVGIWLIDYRSQFPLTPSLLGPAVGLFIGVSVLCMIISVFGCIGAFKEKRGFLTAYVGLVGVLMLMQILVIGLAAAFKSKINDELRQEWIHQDKTDFFPYNQLEKNMNSSYFASFSHLMNKFHVSWECCGVSNYTDITDTDSAWYRANPTYNNSAPMQLPASCCKLTEDGVNKLAHTDDWSGFSQYLKPNSSCPTQVADFNDRGCWSVLENSIRAHTTAIIVGSSLYVIFYIVCILMGCCLIKDFNNGHMYQRV